MQICRRAVSGDYGFSISSECGGDGWFISGGRASLYQSFLVGLASSLEI